MGKDPAHLRLDLLLRPGRMLTLQERRLVVPQGPVKLMRGLPALVRRHAPQQSYLVRAGSLVPHTAPLKRSFAQRTNRPGWCFRILMVAFSGVHSATLS